MNRPMAIVLAAGKGTRMKSELPKVLFPTLGRPMIHYVIDTLLEAGVGRIVVVVGYRADDVKASLAGFDVEYVVQEEQLGTGHAVMMAREQIQSHEGAVLVLAGDSPLTQRSSLQALMGEYDECSPACILGTLHVEDPTGLGRICRDKDGNFEGIVEQKDTTEEQRKITEVNMSTYVFDCKELLHSLGRLTNTNNQQEYYVTDCPGLLKAENKDVRALAVLQACEALSVNSVDQLEAVEAEMQKMGYADART
ncbi:MAG: bifunctional UDP-N-acetylglucosamine pyrophosphorylase/glucosamine-1-phosphate N-acetyltransferase [Pirellulaceae bacterium]|jgi:bifunctional UDP-N-acetylglucosamine pyrophosphorylase/glucosamine-1-phosphate N-acetyltransferase